MKKIIKIALVLLILASCAPQTKLVRIQRVKSFKGNDYIMGQIVQLKLTEKQFQTLLKNEKIKRKNNER